LKAVESLKNRIVTVDQGVKELLTPMPVVVRKVVPSKPISIEVTHDHEYCDDDTEKEACKLKK